MSSAAFNSAVIVVLEREGVFSNSNVDPGGETCFGIARRSHPNISWQPTKEQAIAIYEREYWQFCCCDLLAYPFALAVFDCAVNQGPGVAIKLMQGAIGVAPDGNIGNITKAKMAVVGLNRDVLASFLALRVQRYVSIRDTNAAEYAENNKGWFRRLFLITFEGFNTPTIQQ